jgi:riboflavin synthase
MFTGIVEELGTAVETGPRLIVACCTVAADSDPGASVAVNGVCLTVVRREGEGDPARLAFDLSPETLSRSSLGSLRPGDGVNLERPTTLVARLGGHLVQGHVDGVGTVVEVRQAEPGKQMTIGLPAGLGRYVVEKGSIAVDGVSLTVTDAHDDRFGVALIPYTLEATTLGSAAEGDEVNLEVDVIAKYVESLTRRLR